MRAGVVLTAATAPGNLVKFALAPTSKVDNELETHVNVPVDGL